MTAFSRRHIFISRSDWFPKFLLRGLHLQGVVICTLGIWGLEAAKLHATGEDSVSPQLIESLTSPSQVHEPVTPMTELENLHSADENSTATTNPISTPSAENWNSPSELNKQVTSVAHLENLKLPAESNIEGSTIPNSQLETLEPPSVLMAGPENFDPSLRIPPPLPPTPPPEPTPPTESTEPETPVAVLESIQTDFRSDRDNFDQRNQIIEPTAQFRLRNGNRIRLKTGLNSFEQKGIDSITNIPIQLGWEGKINQVTVRGAAGVDLFNRLPAALNLNAGADVPIGRSATLSGIVEQGPYKFNAKTLDNQITAWRFGPNLYWQIDRNTSLFSLLRFGSYNDGNFEQQSFSRLERKFGQFSVAANLFNWSYTNDFENKSGYFSPPDFLVYNGEVAWEGDIADFLRCRVVANLGRQRLRGEYDTANSLQGRCTVKLSPNIEADVGYSLSNVQNRTGGSAYDNRSLTGQLRVKF